MSTLFKKTIALFLVLVLTVACFAACDKKDAKDYDDDSSEKTVSTKDDQENQETAQTPWIVDVLNATDDKTTMYPYSEGLAFVSYNGQGQFIDKTGNVKFTVDSNNRTEAMSFKNGLLMVWDDKLMTIDGEMIDVQEFDGTAFMPVSIAEELLEAGYFVVEKVSTGYDGAVYEAAIYNAKLAQVQPYSEELYTLFDEHRHGGVIVYNGYLVCESDDWTYHIETGIWGEFKDLVLVNEMDFAYFNVPSQEERGMYRNEEMILDLSAHNTLRSVTFTGEYGLAIFENEEHQSYFTIMDTKGNFLFDPICFSEINGSKYCQINGNVIQTYGKLKEHQDGKYVVRISTYDLTGNLLGSADVVDLSSWGLLIYWGSDSVVVENEDAFTYYDINMNPMFITE